MHLPLVAILYNDQKNFSITCRHSSKKARSRSAGTGMTISTISQRGRLFTGMISESVAVLSSTIGWPLNAFFLNAVTCSELIKATPFAFQPISFSAAPRLHSQPPSAGRRRGRARRSQLCCRTAPSSSWILPLVVRQVLPGVHVIGGAGRVRIRRQNSLAEWDS
jgi:hypothetical protein